MIITPNCTAVWVQRTVTGRDSDGNDAYTDVTVTARGVFAPGGSTEVTQAGDRVTTQPTVYLPLPAPSAVDRVIVNGASYDVDGLPADWSVGSPFTGWTPDYPVVVKLLAVTG